MYSGRLIDTLMETVARAEAHASFVEETKPVVIEHLPWVFELPAYQIAAQPPREELVGVA